MRHGPKVEVRVSHSCDGCEYNSSEKYVCQSDWGFDHYCNEPSMQAKREAEGKEDNRSSIGESNITPVWCPFLG